MSLIFKIILNPVKSIIYIKWILRYLLKGNWRMGTELAYWEYALKYNPHSKNHNYKRFTDEIKPLLNILSELFGEENKPYNLLDVGPGPRTILIEGYRKNLYNLNGIDPLANELKKFICGREFLVQGTCEYLDKIYPPQSFHMVYASNSLDHTEDPLKCFKNMVNATIINGIVVIRSAIKEGSRLNWRGLHQHDLFVDNGKLMHSKRDSEAIDLTEGLPTVLYSYHRSYLGNDNLFLIIYRRVS